MLFEVKRVSAGLGFAVNVSVSMRNIYGVGHTAGGLKHHSHQADSLIACHFQNYCA